MLVERVPVSQLSQDPANARTHSDAQLDAIAASLRRFGQQKPIVARADGIVLAGNGTLAAAIKLGWPEVDVVRTQLAGVEATAYAIADNRTTDLSTFDDAALAKLLQECDAAEALDATGFSDRDLEALLAQQKEITEDDGAPDVQERAVSRRGDVWLLGRHRLLCGDSTKAADVARLMAGAKAGMMVTDPPYGVDYDGGQTNAKKREKLVGDDATDVLNAGLSAALAAVPTGAWYVWHADRNAEPVYAAIRTCGFDVRALIVWNKLKAHYGAPSAHYCQKHEPCLYAVRDGAGFCGPSNEVTVWDIEQPHRNEHHPTQKPVICMARAIRNHESESVYDPFLGSGTTLIAAEQMDRACYAIELDPRYVDVAVRRWQTFTNCAATLDDDGRTFEQVEHERDALRSDLAEVGA